MHQLCIFSGERRQQADRACFGGYGYGTRLLHAHTWGLLCQRLTTRQDVDHVIQSQGSQLKGPLVAFAQNVEGHIAVPHRFARSVANVSTEDLQHNDPSHADHMAAVHTVCYTVKLHHLLACPGPSS